MARIEVLGGADRRRRWSVAQKEAIVAAAFAPGAVVSEVARQADVVPGQIYRWRQELMAPDCGFAEVVVSSGRSMAEPDRPPIELALPGNLRLRIPAMTPPALAAAVIKALVRR